MQVIFNVLWALRYYLKLPQKSVLEVVVTFVDLKAVSLPEARWIKTDFNISLSSGSMQFALKSPRKTVSFDSSETFSRILLKRFLKSILSYFQVSDG